jgi:hypothetical protein
MIKETRLGGADVVIKLNEAEADEDESKLTRTQRKNEKNRIIIKLNAKRTLT